MSAYNYFNLLLRYSMKLKGMKELAATLAVNNIFNTYYSSNGYTYGYYENSMLNTFNYYFPQAGINFLAGVTFKF